MPELPEVETVKRGLLKYLIGKQVKSIDLDTRKTGDTDFKDLVRLDFKNEITTKIFPNTSADVKNFIIDAKVLDVRRRAKVLLIDLSTDYTLVIHLKMTGQMVFKKADDKTGFGSGHPNKSLVGQLPDRSTRVAFNFTDNSKLFFNDQRKFGWIRLIPTAEVMNMPFFQKVGPEPLVDTFTTKEFRQRLRKRNKSMAKAVLLDQSVIAGVGNIYADEALHTSGIHPETRIIELNDKFLDKLYRELREVLQVSIDAGGSTDKNYVNADGKMGSYLTFAKVFRREGKPCLNCTNEIIKTRVAGRGTHLCLVCQVKI